MNSKRYALLRQYLYCLLRVINVPQKSHCKVLSKPFYKSYLQYASTTFFDSIFQRDVSTKRVSKFVHDIFKN